MNTSTATSQTFDVNSYVRQNIRKMKPYSSARDEFKGEAEIFLDANENPYPSAFNRYPDPLQWSVKEKLGRYKNILPEQIFLGNGSDEGIDLLIRAFCEPRVHSIIITEPTYGMYRVCADVNDVRVQQVLLMPDYDLDPNAIKEAIDETTRLIFLCSPNNPTASSLNRDKIIDVIKTFNGIVVIDEAYIDFSTSTSFVQELKRYSNLVVLQTFSKAWGLAGLRLGMAYASTEIIDVLNKIKYPYNINIQTQQLALKALENASQKEKWVEEILAQRDILMNELMRLPVVEQVYPSDANFILVRVKDAPSTYTFLMEKKLIVRDRSKVQLCNNCLRITVGTPAENQSLLNLLKTLS
jgi:histidinol-phosphate aminotransferase